MQVASTSPLVPQRGSEELQLISTPIPPSDVSLFISNITRPAHVHLASWSEVGSHVVVHTTIQIWNRLLPG